jgi:hypothetical protein
VEAVAVCISEGHSGKRCATAWVVNDLLDDTSNVSVPLCVIYGSELGRVLVEPLMGCEDRAAALPLIAVQELAFIERRRRNCIPNHAAHVDEKSVVYLGCCCWRLVLEEHCEISTVGRATSAKPR